MKMLINKPAPHIAALKIWFAGLVTGPFIFIIVSSLFSLVSSGAAGMGNFSSLPVYFIIMALFGAIFSLPSALALWLFLSIQYRFQPPERVFWGTLLIATFLLVLAPFALLSGFQLMTENGTFLGMALAYLLGIWVGVYWAFHQTRFDKLPSDDAPLDTDY